MQTKTKVAPVVVDSTELDSLPAVIPQQSQSNALMQMISTAMDGGRFDIADIRELLAVKKEWEADEARKAYVAAMAEFKAEHIEISKDKSVGYKNKDGSFTGYHHASIGNVVGVVCAALGRHGFSHRWDTKQDGGLISVSCVITHKLGHSESTLLSGKPDDSGKKNAIQQTASTISYLQRYTLLAATGLATRDQEDDDGRTGDAELSPEEQEAADKAAIVLEQWISTVEEAPTIEALKKRKEELVAAYGANSVPKALLTAYNAKLHALQPVKGAK